MPLNLSKKRKLVNSCRKIFEFCYSLLFLKSKEHFSLLLSDSRDKSVKVDSYSSFFFFKQVTAFKQTANLNESHEKKQ
jgi:hypothetical protein